MTDQRVSYAAVTTTQGPYPPPSLDTNTILGVKCVRVTGTQPWRERIGDLLNEMRGPHPRKAIVEWDGSAFRFYEMKTITQRIAVE